MNIDAIAILDKIISIALGCMGLRVWVIIKNGRMYQHLCGCFPYNWKCILFLHFKNAIQLTIDEQRLLRTIHNISSTENIEFSYNLQLNNSSKTKLQS
jgi:hypothetical protein